MGGVMNSLSRCKLAVLFVVTMFSLFNLQVVEAATSNNTMVACSSLKGRITIRQKCKKNEVRLTINALVAQGIQGPKGDRGVSAFDVIPSGTTIYGVLGAALPLPAGEEYVVAQSIPGVLPTPLTDAAVVIANNAVVSSCAGHCLTLTELGESGKCSGSFQAPTAPPGSRSRPPGSAPPTSCAT